MAETEGYRGAYSEIKSKLFMWHNDLNESGATAKCARCFCIDPASQKKRGKAV